MSEALIGALYQQRKLAMQQYYEFSDTSGFEKQTERAYIIVEVLDRIIGALEVATFGKKAMNYSGTNGVP